MSQQLQSFQQGIITEQYITYQCLGRGYNVLQPCGNHLPYDLVLDINSNFIKVQVKTLCQQRRSITLQCRSCKLGGNRTKKQYLIDYTVNDFDFAFCLKRDTYDVWIVPASYFIQKRSFAASKPQNLIYMNAWHLLEEFRSHQLAV